jgi:hypothetical protein
MQPGCEVTFFAIPLIVKFFWRQTALLQFSPDNFSCGTRQEHRYHSASVTTELNLAPHLLQLQNCGTAKP